MKTTLTAILIAASIFTFGEQAQADTVLIKPKGEYATIKTQADIALMRKLLHGDAATKKSAIDETLKAPQTHSPPVLYALSSALMEQRRPDDAVFWYLAAELRGRYDAFRCADDSARSAIPAMHMAVDGAVKPYMHANQAKAKAIIPKVLDWDEKTPYNYDHRWINLHGLTAITGGGNNPLSVPKSEWPAIRSDIRDELAAIADPQRAKKPRQATKEDALFKALMAKNSNAVKQALASGANVNASWHSRTPLMQAAKDLNLDLINAILAKHPNLDAKDNDGQTALLIAINAAAGEKKDSTISKKLDPIVQTLLKAGANANARTEFFGTPLIIAVGCKFVSTARLLLNAKADPNLADLGTYPLHFAAGQGDLAMVKLLIERGACTDIKNDRGETAYTRASGPQAAAIRALLKPKKS